jgi:hypothetical protein
MIEPLSKERTYIYAHPVSPIAPNDFPFLVLLSCRMGAESKLISFSDGGGDPSTQPFQPFLTTGRFLRGCGGRGAGVAADMSRSVSTGVCGLFDDMCDVVDEVQGPGVGDGEGGMGGGVTDIDRGMMMLICGLPKWKTGSFPDALAEVIAFLRPGGGPNVEPEATSADAIVNDMAASFCFCDSS